MRVSLLHESTSWTLRKGAWCVLTPSRITISRLRRRFALGFPIAGGCASCVCPVRFVRVEAVNATDAGGSVDDDLLVRALVQDAFNPSQRTAAPITHPALVSVQPRSSGTLDGKGYKRVEHVTVAVSTEMTEPVRAQRANVSSSHPKAGALSMTSTLVSTSQYQPPLEPQKATSAPRDTDEYDTDSRSTNAAAELFATVSRTNEKDDWMVRALTWTCQLCHFHNPLPLNAEICAQCRAPASKSYRTNFPPLRHVPVMPSEWICQYCSHTNRQASVSKKSAVAHPALTDAAAAARDKFFCGECAQPFGGLQPWICSSCNHICPRAASQCPTCFADRPISWTCRQCGTSSNSVFAAECRACHCVRKYKHSNSVLRCYLCKDLNDVRWELCATCMAPSWRLTAMKSLCGHIEVSEDVRVSKKASQSCTNHFTVASSLPDTKKDMLHSSTVEKTKSLLEAIDVVPRLVVGEKNSSDGIASALTSTSPCATEAPFSGERPRVPVQLKDHAWWCLTCNVPQRRNASFCDICLQSRDLMQSRNRMDLAAYLAASKAETLVSTSIPRGCDQTTELSLVPVVFDGDWQCPYCRKLRVFIDRECCGHPREVPRGYWLCDSCGSTNRSDRLTCLGCAERHEKVCPWRCQECEWHNAAQSTVCMQCGLPSKVLLTKSKASASSPVLAEYNSTSSSLCCSVCNAPNHCDRTACFRCRARLRKVEWSCEACGHGNPTRKGCRCEQCQAIHQFDQREETWICEVCSTAVFSGGDLPVRTNCPRCRMPRAATATHYPARWQCVCGVFNLSRRKECQECGAGRRLTSLDTVATCPHCFCDTHLDVREVCTHCGGSLAMCFEMWTSDIVTGETTEVTLHPHMCDSTDVTGEESAEVESGDVFAG